MGMSAGRKASPALVHTLYRDSTLLIVRCRVSDTYFDDEQASSTLLCYSVRIHTFPRVLNESTDWYVTSDLYNEPDFCCENVQRE